VTRAEKCHILPRVRTGVNSPGYVRFCNEPFVVMFQYVGSRIGTLLGATRNSRATAVLLAARSAMARYGRAKQGA